MTVLAMERPTKPNGHLFESSRGLYPFQVDAVVDLWASENKVAVVDLGLGKTIIFIALACQLIEAGEIDQVIVVARKNKLLPTEFPKDFADFSTLSVVKYLGDGRVKRLQKAQAAGPVDVIMTTYETGKIDLMHRVKDPKKPRARGRAADGPLMESLDLRNRRTLWVFDEIIKLGNRGSETYRAYEYVIGQARKTAKQRVVGLSATPMSTDYDQSFNIGRIVAPWLMPSVTEFENTYTNGRDQYGRYSYKRSAREEFARIFQQLIYRKRFTDPDVRSQYPTLLEKLVPVELEPAHRALYDAVGDLYGDDWDELTDEQLNQLRTALRLTLGHPAAHLHSDSPMSRAIVDTLGEDAIRAIPSSKSRRLIDEIKETGGEQVLVFTFWANTVLPELAADLRAAGLSVVTYTGEQATTANEKAKADFKSGEVQVLLSSDAGAEGLNLPEATYIIEYEPTHTFDRRSQRFGRGTRIGSQTPFIYARTMAVTNTLDAAQVRKVLRRNDWQDTLLGDKGAAGHKDARSRKQQLMNGVSL